MRKAQLKASTTGVSEYCTAVPKASMMAAAPSPTATPKEFQAAGHVDVWQVSQPTRRPRQSAASGQVSQSTLGATGRDALALLVAWPLGTLALLLWPEVGGYWGLSGPIHAGVAVLALRALRTPGTRWLGRLLMAGLVFKLGLEAGWANPVGFNDAWGFNVVYAAHLTGAVAGLATALVLGWLPSASRQNS